MKQNKKTNILKRVFALVVSLIAVLSCIVIAPSADGYDDNFTHYRFSYEYSHAPDLSSYVSAANDMFYFIIESPIQQKVVFNDPSTNTSYTYYFTDLAVTFSLIVQNESNGLSHTLLSGLQLNPHGTDEIFLSTNTYYRNSAKLSSTYKFRSPDFNFEGTLAENGSPFVIDLWIDCSYVSNVYSRKTDGTVLYANHFVPLFTNSSVVSRPKTYSDGYNDGEDMGLGEGYREGYRVGDIEGYNRGFEYGQTMGYGNGYTIGKQEGITEGFNTGHEQGYSEGYDDGVTDGYYDGYDNGQSDGTELGFSSGYQNGFDVGYDTGYDDGYLEGKNDQTPVIPETLKQDLLHLWLYFNANYKPALGSVYDGARHTAFFDSPVYMHCSLIYGRNGDSNLFKTISFKKLAFDVSTGSYTEGDVNYIFREVDIYFDTDFQNGVYTSPIHAIHIHKDWVSGVYQGMSVYSEGLEEYGIEDFNLDWDITYGNYNLQLWLASDYLTDALNQTDSTEKQYLRTYYEKFFTYQVISYPKTYAEGYTNGVDFGLEEGYGNGYDQGSIDGIQQGKEEGYRTGYEEGYGFGFTDGNDEGYELGKDVGYENGYADAKKLYDDQKSWMNFKNLIFAIFDAPFYVISYSLDFDIFGINIAGTLIALISTALIVWILKIIIVKLF